MGDKVIRVIAFMAGGALVIGLAMHATGAATVINAVTGFYNTGLQAELGHNASPPPGGGQQQRKGN